MSVLKDKVEEAIERSKMEVYDVVCHELCKYREKYAEEDEYELWKCCQECKLPKLL